MRNSLPNIIEEIMDINDNVCVLIGDISHYLFRNVEKKFPNKFYNLGIAEQSLISLASGLSLEGMIPIVHSIAPFVTERCYEQIKLDIGYQNQEIIIISVGASFDYAHLGCSHHCYNDISILRLIPNIDIYSPGSKLELDYILKNKIGNGVPKYIKIYNQSHSYDKIEIPHKFHLINEGNDDKVIIFLGSMLFEMGDEFKNSTILYSNTCTNFSSEEINKLKKLTTGKEVFVIEENNINGGFGDYISEILQVNINKIAIPNNFIEKYGTYAEIKNYVSLNNKSIFKQVYEN